MSQIFVRNSPDASWQPVSFDDAKTIAASLYVYASGCAALTSLEAPKAQTVDARGCAALTSLEAPQASQLALGENRHELLTDLNPWREEMAECERIFSEASPQVGDVAAWLHHEVAFERLTYPWRDRLNYIAAHKPEEERAWRFRLMRPSSIDAMRAAIASIGKVG